MHGSDNKSYSGREEGHGRVSWLWRWRQRLAGAACAAAAWLLRTATVGAAMAGLAAQAGAAGAPSWGPVPRRADQAGMTLQCPRAYLGVRQDLLPTHWEIVSGRVPLRLKASQVQRGELLCIYQDEKGRSVGSVRRLAPGGYKCISDGAGSFRCRRGR